MAIGVTIGGIARTSLVRGAPQRRTLSFSLGLGSDWTCSFEVQVPTDSTASAYRPAVDDEVTITHDVDGDVFHGVITSVQDAPWGGTGTGVLTLVTAKANTAITDQVQVAPVTYVSGLTLKQVVADLVSTYLVSFGITLDAGMASGPTLEEQIFDRARMGDVLNHLSSITGWLWRVTPADVLEFFSPGSKTAPYSLTAANGLALGPVTWEQTRKTYLNRIHVRYGTETVVDKIDTFTGDGATTQFVLTYPLAATPSYLMVGAQAIGINTTWSLSGQTITFTSAPAAAAAISITYAAQFPNTVTVADAAEIAAHGLWESTFDAPDVFDINAATEIANGFLRQKKINPKRVAVATKQGFQMPGTSITLTFADRTVSGSHLITQVNAVDVLDGQFEYSFSCVSGAEGQQSFTDALRTRLSGSVTGSSGGTVSGSVIPALSGRFNSDVVANSAEDTTGTRESSLSNYQNSSTDGPAVLLGRPGDVYRWAIVANHLSAGRRGLRFIAPEDATASGGSTAAELSTDPSGGGSPTNGVYYLVPGPGGLVLHLGAPTASGFGPGFRIEKAHLNDCDASSGYTERSRTAKMGEWISPTFAASDFSASGTMTWTVASGEVGTYAYMLVGKALTIAWYLTGGTTGGTAAAELLIKIPGGFTAAKTMIAPCRVSDGTDVLTLCLVSSGGTNIRIFRDATFGTNYGLGAGRTTQGTITLEIQ